MSNELSTTQQFLQVVVTLLGIASQVVLLLRARAKTTSEEAHPKPIDEDHPPSDTIAPRNFIDLSFVLICSAFFSLLLTDSLVISGRTPAPEVSTILIVICITTVVVGTMVGSWLYRKTELVTGFLAITTLCVLIISPGGPIFSSVSDGETGLSLLIPVVTLVALSAAMLIYSFGSPLSKSVKKSRRTAISCGLGIIVIVGAIALGQQLLGNVTADKRTPKLDTDAIKTVLPALANADLKDKKIFYQLASEIALLRTYQNHFRAVRGERAPQPTPAPSPTSSATPTNATAGAAQPASSPPAEPKKTEAETLTEARAVELLIQRARADNDWQALTQLQSFARRSNGMALAYLAERDKNTGRARPNLLVDYFDALDVNEQQEYLAQRLNWIHPVGLPSQVQAGIQLPGLSATDRFEAISSIRIIQVLDDQENLRTKLFQEFDKQLDYPREVRNAFREADEYGNQYAPSYNPRRTRPRNLFKPVLFPKLDPNPNNSRLIEQLALPFEVEAYVAYRQYKRLAHSLIKRIFKDKIGEEESERIANSFEELGDQTQEAFLVYVVYNSESQGVYQMLIDLHDKKVDFTPLLNSKDPLVVDALKSLLDKSSATHSDPQIQQIANGINSIASAGSKRIFRELLAREELKTPIKYLFDPKIFELVDQINKNLTDQRREFFDAVADPVWLVSKDAAATAVTKNGSNANLPQVLEKFRSLTENDQNQLLHHLAISLYQPGGDNSLDPIRLLVVEAKAYSKPAALITASLLSLPLLLIAVFVGGFFARKLVARDRMRELVQKETLAYPEEESTFGTPVELMGRDDLLKVLLGLTKRGWSTIGVVGRRGVGKSRLLRAMLQTGYEPQSKPLVKVWVSSPSKFHEEDFISSMLERLAFSTESAIASYLRVRPISIRRIEVRAAQVGTWLFIGALFVLTILIYSMASRLTRPDIIITWIPILAIVCTSVGFFLSYMSNLQPVDLSSWLQRDRTHNPHTVMLYREVYAVLTYLRRRNAENRRDRLWARGLPRWGLLLLFGLAFIYCAAVSISIIDDAPSVTYALPYVLIAALALVAWLYVYLHSSAGGHLESAQGQSLMSLIAEYRAFASTIVYRLRQGALGRTTEHGFSVLVCVDELDKIVDFEDIRTFVRRIKAIFEVPGVYYYVSLAEDTLNELYLGPAEGKNEIDSSFDHIIRIPPVPCDIGNTIAARYLESREFPDPPQRFTRTIATLSFGVPRDILRRCDEYIAQKNPIVDPSHFCFQIRKRQAVMGYELKQLTRKQMNMLTVPAWDSAVEASQIIDEVPQNEATRRLVLLLWIVSLTEASLLIPEEEGWNKITQELCATGYRLPIDQLADLEYEIRGLHDSVADLLGVPKLGITQTSVTRIVA
ncbi:MAG TPA: hypothetical protein VF290_13010 [Pyrinomonadaceae bacterium]